MRKHIRTILIAALLTGSVAISAVDERDSYLKRLEQEIDREERLLEQRALQEEQMLLAEREKVIKEKAEKKVKKIKKKRKKKRKKKKIKRKKRRKKKDKKKKYRKRKKRKKKEKKRKKRKARKERKAKKEVKKKKKKRGWFSWFRRGKKKKKKEKVSRIKKEEKRRVKDDTRRKKRAEKRKVKAETRKHDLEMAKKMVEKKERRRRMETIRRREENKKLEGRWAELRKAEAKHDYELGRYADLTKSPAWGPFATTIPHTYLMNVGTSYMYATDGYSSEGVNFDISKLAFGDCCIRIKDLLLVSKLAQNGIVTLNDYLDGSAVLKDIRASGSNAYLKYLADQKVLFKGEIEEWKTTFDLARYLWNRNYVVGIHVPVVYKQHNLKAEMCLDQKAKEMLHTLGDDITIPNNNTIPNAFMRRYGQDTNMFLEDIFNAKCFKDLGGSSGGLGDISVYAHVNFESARFDDMIVGLRCIIPTADKRSTNKVWAPELGNGGFFQVNAYGGVTLFKSKYFNPHVFVQATGSFTSRVDRRAPKRIVMRNPNPAPAPNQDPLPILLDKVEDKNFCLPCCETSCTPDCRKTLAFADRAKLPGYKAATGVGEFDEWEAPLKELGDNILNLKMRKGEEFNVRIGNMIEKFIYRRAFFDLYYDLRMKFRDTFSDYKEDVWNLDPYRINSQEIAHTVGSEFSYQFDKGSRLRCGFDYIFAGYNVPKALTLKLNMDYSF